MGARLVIEDALPGRSRPDASEAPTHRLEAGTELEELERLGGWVRVATSDGRTVWVDGRRLGLPAAEVTTDAPAPVPADARRRGVVATVVAGLGLLAVVVGIGVLLTQDDEDAVSVPPTVPATVATTVAPAVTEAPIDPTATSVPWVVLDEAFEGSTEWPLGTEDAFTRTVTDGVYRIDYAPAAPGQGYTWRSVTTSPTATRFALYATVGPRSPFGARCGLAMAVGDPDLPRVLLLFDDVDGGSVNAYLQPAWDLAPEAILGWTAAPPGTTDGSLELSLVMDDGQLEVWIGESVLGTLASQRFVPATVALVVGTPSDGTPSSCTFDDVVLFQQ